MFTTNKCTTITISSGVYGLFVTSRIGQTSVAPRRRVIEKHVARKSAWVKFLLCFDAQLIGSNRENPPLIYLMSLIFYLIRQPFCTRL